jgi:tocopherol cyclase
MLYRIYHPEIFQGSLRKKHYFEGWYFKHIDHDQSCVISVIPGVSIDGDDSHAFIQVLDSDSGNSSYIVYPLDEFRWDRKKMNIQVGNSEFTLEHIRLNIANDNLTILGQVDYENVTGYPGSILSPGIMGWYSFVPFMECNHGILSVIHDLKGKISINGKITDFTGGKGYAEKDWGSSFPEGWIWIQSCNFPENDVSFSFSVAKIPWLGSFFTGFICYLYAGRKFYLFSTYNGSVIEKVTRDNEKIGLSLKGRKYSLTIEARSSTFGKLVAPVKGGMSRQIRESVDSEVYVRLANRSNNLLYSGTGKNAGFEIEEKIFDYLM